MEQENKLEKVLNVLREAYFKKDLELLYYAKFRYQEMLRAMERLLPYEYTKLYTSDLNKFEIKELLNKTEFYLYKISVEKMEVNYGQA